MNEKFESAFPITDSSAYDFSGPNIIDRVNLSVNAQEGWGHLTKALAYEIQERSNGGKLKTWCGMEMAYEQKDGSLVLAVNYTIGNTEEAITMLVAKGEWQLNHQQN